MTAASMAERMSPRLLEVMGRAQRSPRMRFFSLAHFIDEEALKRAYERIRKDAAVGVDGVTGDSCLFASDCPAGASCDYLFCSKPCSADADCAGSHAGGQNAQGTANHCVLVVNAMGATVPICDPGCAGANDCLALGQYCRSTQAVGAGPATMVCWQTP